MLLASSFYESQKKNSPKRMEKTFESKKDHKIESDSFNLIRETVSSDNDKQQRNVS